MISCISVFLLNFNKCSSKNNKVITGQKIWTELIQKCNTNSRLGKHSLFQIKLNETNFCQLDSVRQTLAYIGKSDHNQIYDEIVSDYKTLRCAFLHWIQVWELMIRDLIIWNNLMTSNDKV